MQLEELLNKKKKVQAVQKEDQSAVMAPVNNSVPVNPPAPMNVHPPAYQTATADLLKQSMHHKDQHQLSSISSQSSQITGTGIDNNNMEDAAEEDITTINRELVAHQECVGDAISLETTEETAPSILGHITNKWLQESTMDNNKCKPKL